MDVLTLALAKKYTDSQRLGYEENKEIVWDGNTAGKYIIEEVLALVSTVPMDLTSVERVTINNGLNEYITYDNSVLTVAELDENKSALMVGEFSLVVSVTKNYFLEGTEYKTGTYLYFKNAEYVSKVETKETIHTINPKFLPGVCLPVVELSTTLSPGASFTEEENAKLNAIWESGTPMVTNCILDLGNNGRYTDCRVVWSMATVDGDFTASSFVTTFGNTMLQIYRSEGLEGWSFNAQ